MANEVSKTILNGVEYSFRDDTARAHINDKGAHTEFNHSIKVKSPSNSILTYFERGDGIQIGGDLFDFENPNKRAIVDSGTKEILGYYLSYSIHKHQVWGNDFNNTNTLWVDNYSYYHSEAKANSPTLNSLKRTALYFSIKNPSHTEDGDAVFTIMNDEVLKEDPEGNPIQGELDTEKTEKYITTNARFKDLCVRNNLYVDLYSDTIQSDIGFKRTDGEFITFNYFKESEYSYYGRLITSKKINGENRVAIIQNGFSGNTPVTYFHQQVENHNSTFVSKGFYSQDPIKSFGEKSNKVATTRFVHELYDNNIKIGENVTVDSYIRTILLNVEYEIIENSILNINGSVTSGTLYINYIASDPENSSTYNDRKYATVKLSSGGNFSQIIPIPRNTFFYIDSITGNCELSDDSKFNLINLTNESPSDFILGNYRKQSVLIKASWTFENYQNAAEYYNGVSVFFLENGDRVENPVETDFDLYYIKLQEGFYSGETPLEMSTLSYEADLNDNTAIFKSTNTIDIKVYKENSEEEIKKVEVYANIHPWSGFNEDGESLLNKWYYKRNNDNIITVYQVGKNGITKIEEIM
jgi:hypothetical protein